MDLRRAQVLTLPILHDDLSAIEQPHGACCCISLAEEQEEAMLALVGGDCSAGRDLLAGTAHEWYDLIYNHGLTIRTNLFGTTFYSLVGLHATHVVVGLIMLSLALWFSLRGEMTASIAKSLRCCRSIGTLSMGFGLLCFWLFTCWEDEPRKEARCKSIIQNKSATLQLPSPTAWPMVLALGITLDSLRHGNEWRREHPGGDTRYGRDGGMVSTGVFHMRRMRLSR